MKLIHRLLFVQGGLCFFCRKPLPLSEASVEHLVATSNGGTNNPENCVACCRSLNTILGRMSLKEKLRVVMDQQGKFQCPRENQDNKAKPGVPEVFDQIQAIITYLQSFGKTPPASLKTLKNSISAFFQNSISEQEILLTIEELKTREIVSVEGARLSYKLPSVIEATPIPAQVEEASTPGSELTDLPPYSEQEACEQPGETVPIEPAG